MNRSRLVPILLLIPVVFIYRGFLDYYFAFEDFSYLFGARHYFHPGNFFTHTFGSSWYRPAGLISWFLNYRLSGFAAWQYYLINVILHFLNAAMVYGIGVKLNGSRRAGILAGLVFAAHPVSTTTTLYLGSRFDVLGATFILASLSLYLSSDKNHLRVLSVACALLAMLSKEMFITAPLLVFALAFVREEHDSLRAKVWAALKKSAPYFIPAFIYVIVRISVLQGLGGYMYKREDIVRVIVGTPVNILHSLFIAPRMLVLGNLPATTGTWAAIIAFALVLAAGIYVFRARRKSRKMLAALAGLLLAVVAILPVLNYPDVLGSSPRFFYLPLAGFAVFIGAMLDFRNGNMLLALPLALWLYGSNMLAQEWKDVSHRERTESAQVIGFLEDEIPRAEPGTTFVFFGLDPAGYNLDFTVKALWPSESRFNGRNRIFGYRFLYGDRNSFVVALKGVGLERSKRRYQSVADSLSEEDFNVQDADFLFLEMVKPPDILREMADGRMIRVIEYSGERELKDITAQFQGYLEARKNSGVAAKIFEWNMKDSNGWASGGNLKEGVAPGVYHSSGDDPYITSPRLSMQGMDISAIEIEMRVSPAKFLSPRIAEGQLMWESSDDPSWALKRLISFPVLADGTMHTYRINLSRCPAWYLGGEIESVRLDPVSFPAEIEISRIRFF